MLATPDRPGNSSTAKVSFEKRQKPKEKKKKKKKPMKMSHIAIIEENLANSKKKKKKTEADDRYKYIERYKYPLCEGMINS